MIGTATECPKITPKSVLHLLKYTANLYLTDAVQIFGKFGTLSTLFFINLDLGKKGL